MMTLVNGGGVGVCTITTSWVKFCPFDKLFPLFECSARPKKHKMKSYPPTLKGFQVKTTQKWCFLESRFDDLPKYTGL